MIDGRVLVNLRANQRASSVFATIARTRATSHEPECGPVSVGRKRGAGHSVLKTL